MTLFAVFLLSVSALAYEVVLTRVFSISQWNHLSFMVISVALFGFAASGTFVNIVAARKKDWERRLSSKDSLYPIIIIYSLTAIISYLVLNRLPLDYFRLPLESIQILYLLLAYLFLSLPFFFTGLAVTLAYAYVPEKTGLIYFASMSGSACGAVIPFLLLPLFGEGNLILLASLIPLLLVLFKAVSTHVTLAPTSSSIVKKRLFYLVSFLALVAITIFLTTAGYDTVTRVNPSSYKALSQILQFPNTVTTTTTTSIRGRFDSVESPFIRFAPGLSLKYANTLPATSAVFRDGDTPFFFYDLKPERAALFSDFILCYMGYLLVPNPADVLIIQRSGGLAIPCAIASKARKITIVEQQPHIAQLIKQHYRLEVIKQSPRAFLRQSDKKYHIIHIENWGSSLPGASVLTQEHLFTKESITAYLHHLSNNGILIFARKLLLPPSDLVRLWAVTHESLKSFGIEHPQRHMAVLRNWNTYTLIVSAQRLNDTGMLQEVARNLNFDLVYLPDIHREMVNRFNVFDAPFHFTEIDRLAAAYRSGSEKMFFDTYFLDVAPQTDNRPFPGRFLKWSKLKTLYKMTGSRFYSLFMSGEVVVAVVFFEAFLITLFLLVFPLMAIATADQRPYFFNITYFLGVGSGFMFIELFYIHKYTFVLGDPVVSFTVVLAGILIFSSIGGYWSQHMGPRTLRYIIIVLVLVLILLFFGLDSVSQYILGFPTGLQYIMAVVLLLPPGIIVGIPFPLGMRYLLNNPSHRAYAWAANGCSSVLAAILSAQIALSFGITAIMAGAILAYLAALFSIFPSAMPKTDKI